MQMIIKSQNNNNYYYHVIEEVQIVLFVLENESILCAGAPFSQKGCLYLLVQML